MPYANLFERLVAHTAEPENGQACWLHDGPLNKKDGYPQVNIRVDGNVKHFYAHRLMYEEFHGPIPDGFDVDHLCHVHRCIYPDHLVDIPADVNRSINRKGLI